MSAQPLNALEKLREATRMLAEVRTATDAKKLADLAAAAEYYARKAKLGEEAVSYAHAIKIDSKRLLGGFLRQAEKNAGSLRRGSHEAPRDGTPTLNELGLTKKESAESQLLHAVAEKKPEEFANIRDGKKTITRVRREMKRAEVTETAALPSDKFRVIYADPPWKYGDALMLDAYGSASYHYPSMMIGELCALPVAELCEKNAVLFLWVTAPLLEESFAVIKAWGFKYKTSFVWDKVRHNVGHYNSVRHEFLLVCTRGSCTPDVAKLYDSVVTIERTEHSAKPEEFRAMIETLYTVGKKLELFARSEHPGWTAHGNQLQRAAS